MAEQDTFKSFVDLHKDDSPAKMIALLIEEGTYMACALIDKCRAESMGNKIMAVYFDRKANAHADRQKWVSFKILDRFEMLKEYEPRVMTLEEYDAWTDLPFTERDPVFHEERTKRGSVTCWVNTAVCSLREYGKNDRCWTSRPTREEMEATPW